MATEYEVFLQGGSPWGFRLQGGREFRLPLKIAKVEPGGKADIAGIQVDDHVVEINDVNTASMYHTEALTAVKRAQSTLSLVLTRPEGDSIEKPVTTSKESIKPQPSPQSSTILSESVPGGQSYMKKIFDSIDDLLAGYSDADLPPLDRERSKTLPKKLPARDRSLNSSDSSGTNSLPRTSSISGGTNKTPNWYKQMYKEMHDSMEKESHLSKLLSTDAQKGAFRKYDGASTAPVATSHTTDNVPRRLQGGGRAVATNPNRKSLPNLHAANFNFMSSTNTAVSNSTAEKNDSEEKEIRRKKSINSELYKHLQKGGEIPEVGLAVRTENKLSHSHISASNTEKHKISLPIAKQESSLKEQFITKDSAVTVAYNPPADFLDLRKRELKNAETEKEREAVREKRERERIEEEQRLHEQKELDKNRIKQEEEQKKQNLMSQSKIEEMVSLEVKENQMRFLQNQKENLKKPAAEEVFDFVQVVNNEHEAPLAALLEEKIMLAKARYTFHPQGQGELDFKKGQIIRILHRIDENWLEGELNGEIGIFPVSYVQIIEEKIKPTSTKVDEQAKIVEEPQQQSKVSPKEVEIWKETKQDLQKQNGLTSDKSDRNKPISLKFENIRGSAEAKYTFKAEKENELSFKKGELISLIRQIDENWFEGETTNGLIGIVPVNYVKVLMQPAVQEVKDAKNNCNDDETLEEQVVAEQHRTPNGDINFEKIFEDALQPKKSILIEDSCEKKDHEKCLSYEETNQLRVKQQTSNIDDLLGMGETFRVVFSYNATNEDEVDLQVGDIVHVLEQCDDGWFVGTSQRTGAFGTFPGNYVTPF